MKRLLLVDDDVELATMLAEYLRRDGFEVVLAHDLATAETALQPGDFDLLVLDVMLPDGSGIELLRTLRGRCTVPVLMLTARGDDIDRIVGLELGADDYVPKPCTPRELAARIRAILRRSRGSETHDPALPLEIGPLRLWSQKRLAQWNDAALTLTSTEFNLLEVLARNAGRPVSKQALSEQALGRPLARFDRGIDVHISSIRHKLGARRDGLSWIQTVRGVGYQFVRD